MTGRLDEINACMDSVVDNVHSVHFILGLKVGIESLLNVFDNWPPGVVVVDEISKARCINDCQTQPDSIFLDVGTD